MGANQSGQSGCVVKTQIGVGRSVRVLCFPVLSNGPDEDAAKVGCDMQVPHGRERTIEAPFFDESGLRIALQVGVEDARVLLVPNGATLFLRTVDGHVVLRMLRMGEQAWEVPSYSDATTLFRSVDLRIAPTDAALSHVQDDTQTDIVFGEDATDASRQDAASSTAHKQGPEDTPASANPHEASGDDGYLQASRVPHECACPISHELFVDPVLAADGFTYERACIEEWWRRRGPQSPMTGRNVTSTTLTPNLAILVLCDELRSGDDAGGPPRHIDFEAGGSFYEPHFRVLAEMFGHLDDSTIRSVFIALEAEEVRDMDVCVRHLLELQGPDGEAGAVSLGPVCCAAGPTRANSTAALAILDPMAAIPDSWSPAKEALFAELLELGFPAVRARKAIDDGVADDADEAVEWLERHQEDADIDTPIEVLQQMEDVGLASDVLRVATVPVMHRLRCFQAVHQVLGNILADPTSEKVRKLRIRNPQFKERIGRFRPAVHLLRTIGFVRGDYWVSAFDKEPCLEFRLPVDSDNRISQRFYRAYSLIDEVLRSPEEWISTVVEAQPEVQSQWAAEAEAEAANIECNDSFQADAHAGSSRSGPSRAFLAEVHERRARDPRGFQEAMRAAGAQANKMVINVRTAEDTDEHARRLAAASTSAYATRPLEQRYGRREFNLSDLEEMRVQEAIAGTTLYAREYDESRGQASTVGHLVSRMYDPQYLGRKAVDNTNVFRAQQKMPPLRWHQPIADIAAEHARQMARGEMPFSHQGFDDRVRRYPIPHMSAAENLAYNSGVSDSAGVAVDGWIKSPGHRKNLLGQFDLCGVGVAQSSTGQFFFTQLFCRSAGGALA